MKTVFEEPKRPQPTTLELNSVVPEPIPWLWDQQAQPGHVHDTDVFCSVGNGAMSKLTSLWPW